MPDSLPYGEYLPGVYRFAFLMTGSLTLAVEVLRLVVEQAERSRLGSVRDPRQTRRWLFVRARALCARPVPTVLIPVPAATVPDDSSPFSPLEIAMPVPDAADDPPAQLARDFAILPEAERSALILFYLYLFDSIELAETLEIRPDELGPLLLRGRTMLKRRMKDEG